MLFYSGNSCLPSLAFFAVKKGLTAFYFSHPSNVPPLRYSQKFILGGKRWIPIAQVISAVNFLLHLEYERDTMFFKKP